LAHASKRIKILNWVAGEVLDELLTNAMIFVLPSDLEGLSLALLDAMGAGLCVLCSDVAENREAIDDAGFTFRRGDVPDLADRLRSMERELTDLKERVDKKSKQFSVLLDDVIR